MKNDVDFTKIMDGERLIGVLNFNNMIPVDESCVSSLDLRITEKDDIPSKKYKKMAIKQIEWCRNNQESIVKKANKLYEMIQSEKASAFLKSVAVISPDWKRCCRSGWKIIRIKSTDKERNEALNKVYTLPPLCYNNIVTTVCVTEDVGDRKEEYIWEMQ